MTQSEAWTIVRICAGIVLLLAPFAGIHRAVRRLRSRTESTVAPILATCVVATYAVIGLLGTVRQEFALGGVLLALFWLVAALASNGLVRRGKAKLQAAEQAVTEQVAQEPPVQGQST